MVQIIFEQLVNVTLQEYISPNISSHAALAMSREKVIVQELPNINFIWSCWTILQIIGDTLTDYCIEKVEQWDQLFSDGTGRRKTTVHNLVIVVIDE